MLFFHFSEKLEISRQETMLSLLALLEAQQQWAKWQKKSEEWSIEKHWGGIKEYWAAGGYGGNFKFDCLCVCLFFTCSIFF